MIIKSLLSQDFYKLSMLRVFFREFPDVDAKYRFKCRNEDVDLMPFKQEIEEEINDLCELQFSGEELDYLDTIRFFSPAYVNYLEDYTLKRRYINVGERNKKLDIVMEGPITGVSPFEIFVLKIVHEVYTRNVNPPNETILTEGRKRLVQKIRDFQNFEIAHGFKPTVIDFGGRRAYTTEWHEYVVKNLAAAGVIIGTSDVDLARRLNIKPIGTFAHEYIQTFQGLGICPVMESQKVALQTWANVYRGDLGIALSDTLGDAKFLVDFDPYFAKLFDGVRHDSGDPTQWGNMMITHYKAFNIDPMTKTLVFSDGLDFQKMFELALHFKGKIKTSFGIGTNLTNDLGIPALQNVIKQVECNGNPTAKLSNNPSKTMCEDESFMAYLRSKLAKM
jgi:nicotinate phosphoribosyltransferase